MDTRGPQTFRKRIATAIALLLVVHVLLCLYFTVTPRSYILHRSALGALYHRVFLIGPFFTEQRIASSTHLHIRYKVKDGTWSEMVNYTNRVHREGTPLLLQYNEYRHDDLLRYLARSYRPSKTNPEKSTRQACILCRYSIHELIPPGQSVDSINLLFIHNTYLQKNTSVRSDTLWNIMLNPERCVR